MNFLFRIALFCVLTQQVVAISFRRFRTTYRSHLQLNPEDGGKIGRPETSVTNSCNNVEVRSSHLLRAESLKSRLRSGYFHFVHLSISSVV